MKKSSIIWLIIAIIVILVLIFLFYWFELRASQIRKNCWQKVKNSAEESSTFSVDIFNNYIRNCLYKYGLKE